MYVHARCSYCCKDITNNGIIAENKRRRGNLVRYSELETCSPVIVVAVGQNVARATSPLTI